MKKHLFRHLFLSLLMFVCWVSIFLCIGAYVFLTTTWGAKKAVTYLMEAKIPFCKISVGSYQGTVEKGLLLKDVTISDIPSMKEGNIHIQDLYLQIPLLRWDQISVKLVDARLNLAGAEPIIFNGTMVQGKIQGNCYAHIVDARQIVSAFGYEELAKNIYGFITHVDFVIQGVVNAPRFTGHFFVDKFNYKDTQISDGFGRLDLTVMSLGSQPSMKGSLILESAILNTHRVNVDLITSKVNFKGDVKNPLLDIHGTSKVEDMTIDMSIKGSLQKPQLIFTSDPPLPEDKILMILATKKSWSGLEEDRSQAFGLRKKLTNAFNVGMEVEERPSQLGQSQTSGYTQTIEGQMNVTDTFSLNVARRFLPTDTTSTAGTSQPINDKEAEFYLQYKQRF